MCISVNKYFLVMSYPSFLLVDVNVMFVEGSYSYSEGDGSASDIRVTTNRPFAQDISLTVSGGNQLPLYCIHFKFILA